MLNAVLLNLLLEHHLQGDHELGVLLASAIDTPEFATSQRFTNVEVVQVPTVIHVLLTAADRRFFVDRHFRNRLAGGWWRITGRC